MRNLRFTGSKTTRWYWVGCVGVVAIAGALLFPQLAQNPSSNARFTEIATADMAGGEAVSNGACWADFDGDGDQDLYVPTHRGRSRLWRNDGNRLFTDVAGAAGVRDGLRFPEGCAFVDADNDGRLDLFVTAQKRGNRGLENKLFQNRGDGTFADVTAAAAMGMPEDGVASIDWADYDRDGDLDAFAATRWGKKKRLNALFEQRAPFSFVDVAQARGVADLEGPPRAFIGSWFDYDSDGDVDLLVAIDFWGLELYRNDGEHFTRTTTVALPPATDATPGAPPNNPMGITWGDYDNDGCMDVFITGTNMPGQGGFESRTLGDLASRLYRGNCKGTFSDATEAAGLGPTGVVEWSANFVDFDNDGDLDLSVVAGYPSGYGTSYDTSAFSLGMAKKVLAAVVAIPRRLIPPSTAAWAYRYEAMVPAIGNTGPAAAMPNFLYRNMLMETGKAVFVDVTDQMGVRIMNASLGSAWADLDNDGDLDWFIPGRATPQRLFLNAGPVGRYVRVHLVGSRLRDPIGAWVKIRAGSTWQMRYVHVLDGYLSQSQMDPHFGLGEATVVDEIWVRWPGTTTWVLVCQAIPANRVVTVKQDGSCGSAPLQ